MARYVNRNKFESRYEMLNFVALEYWSYGENGDGFGMARNAFFTADPTDDIQSLHRTGRTNGIKWGRSDLRLGKFRFSDFLDCTDCAEVKNIGGRLSERVFVYNNLLNPGTGYTPQQLVYGINSGIPGIFQIPRHPGALFARSLQRMISGIHYAQERGAPIPLGDDFPYEPGTRYIF